MRWTTNISHGLRIVTNAFRDDDNTRLPSRFAKDAPSSRRKWLIRLAVLVVVYILLFFLSRGLLITNSRLLLPLPHNSTSGWDMSTTAADLWVQFEAEPQNAQPVTDGRYLHVANQHKNSGLNNLVQELVLLAELARQSHRALVVRPLLMDRWAPLPPHVFLSGPAVGGSFPPGQDAPRGVSPTTWASVCPPSRVQYFTSAHVNAMLGVDKTSEGSEIMNRWADWLGKLSHPCVEIIHGPPLVFDFPMVVSPLVISLFPTMSKSPITTGFAWSPIVQRAVTKALHIIQPDTASENTPILHGLAALHIRRGDFEGHCHFLQGRAQGYNSWNLLPSLPDSFNPTQFSGDEEKTTEHFQRHCWPSIGQIIARLRQVARGVDQVYVMTNGQGEWLDGLVAALKQDGWRRVVTSAEVKSVLVDAESVVDQAVDMEIARRAELLVGNGFSSLTSNVVLLRLAIGNDPSTVRFW